MSLDSLLSRLANVKQTGSGRWVARCPAHDDKNPSLSIRETNDGRTLAHCFGGCSIEDVMAAVGLTISDLFAERPLGDHVKRERRPFDAHDVLACIELEALIVVTSAHNMAEGWPLSDVDRKRLALAAERLAEARRLANGE